AQLILDGFQTDFPVVENGRVVGILTRSDLINALTQKGEHSLVETVMQRSFETADSGEMLERVFSRLQTGAFNSVPIIDRSRLVGLVTAENIAELLMIKEALRTRMAA
ncbi:MAG TPA: CBS domain-containing protein, partial [Oligoflexia bacterium]|nr:CBS domain-containing protein [Oligoflexia bacterium]